MRKQKTNTTNANEQVADPGAGRHNEILGRLKTKRKPKSEILLRGIEGDEIDVELYSVWRHRSTKKIHIIENIEKTMFYTNIALIECDFSTMEEIKNFRSDPNGAGFRIKKLKIQELLNLYYFVT